MSDYSSEEEVRVQKGEGAQGAPPPRQDARAGAGQDSYDAC